MQFTDSMNWASSRGVRPETIRTFGIIAGTLAVAAAWQQVMTGLRPLFAPMLVGVTIGAVIYGAVPQTFLASVAGPGNPLAVPVAAILGIPMYVRAEAALPIGLALTSAGVGLGPVFALIIGGAGASIPEVSMLSALFKPRLLGAFIASILFVAIAGGFLIPLFI